MLKILSYPPTAWMVLAVSFPASDAGAKGASYYLSRSPSAWAQEFAPDDATPRDPRLAAEDAELANRVRAALSEEIALHVVTLDLLVNERRVTLKGAVADAAQAQRIEQRVREVDGVSEVVNWLTVDR